MEHAARRRDARRQETVEASVSARRTLADALTRRVRPARYADAAAMECLARALLADALSLIVDLRQELTLAAESHETSPRGLTVR